MRTKKRGHWRWVFRGIVPPIRVWIPALVLLAIGCAQPEPSPRVRVSVVDGSPELPEYLDAVDAWAPLGFVDVSFWAFGDTRECPRRWNETGDVDCQITLELIRDVMPESALSDIALRGIAISEAVSDQRALLISVAHEVGHILLDTPRHTVGGIMSGTTWRLGDADRALACETIHRC